MIAVARLASSILATALSGVGSQLSAQATADSRQPIADGPEPVVVELQIGRLASRTVPAYRVRSEALVPLTQFLQLAEILFRLSPEGRLEATIDPGSQR